MKRLERSVIRALFVALGMAAAVSASASVAAADDIARPPGAIDHRGYELVSLADKGNNQIRSATVAPDDSSRVLYDIYGGAGGSPGGLAAMFLATRTDHGWESRNYLPSRANMIRSNYVVNAVSPDLSNAIVSAFDGIGATNESSDITLARLNAATQQSILRAFPFYFGTFGIDLEASIDLRHVFAAVPDGLTPNAAPWNIYDFGSGTPELVSRLPTTDQGPQCGVPEPFFSSLSPGFPTSVNSVTQHWVSDAGTRVFFTTEGDTCTGIAQLYMRDLRAGTTTLISGPPVDPDPDNGVDMFLNATPDGSFAFFRTGSSLVAADDDDGNSSDLDIYRWSAATQQNMCLTCGTVSANVSAAFIQNTNAVVSEDGSHVYFTSAEKLGDAPTAATSDAPNLYVWRLHHSQLHYIARVDGITLRPAEGGETTPDGKTVLFSSFQPGLDASSGGANGGTAQLYRWDERDDSVTCVSCLPGGALPSAGVISLADELPGVRPHVRAMTDDGSMVFFSVLDPLVPEDVNGTTDIYEWHNGTVKLITDGRTVSPADAAPHVLTVTADGHDVYFVDPARLTWEATDSLTKVFDARVDGGFPAPPAPPTPCNADACHGAPTPTPPLNNPAAGSGGNAAPGTLSLVAISRTDRARLARSGRLTLHASVDGGGSLSAIAQAKIGKRVRTVARADAVARAAGLQTLQLRLSRAARRQLAKRGRLNVVIAVRFSGALDAQRTTVVLTVPKQRRSR